MKQLMSSLKSRMSRKILNGLSLSAMLFVFQACYGTAQDFEVDTQLEGIVKSKETMQPVEGIKVYIPGSDQYTLTGDDGKFQLFIPYSVSYTVHFNDIDSIERGHFKDTDTVITTEDDYIFLNILLETK
jgi:hypothetical protein